MNFEQYLEKLATDDQATRKTEELLQSLSIQELRKLAGLEELVRPVVPLLDDAAIMAMRLYKPEESQKQVKRQLSGEKTKKASSIPPENLPEVSDDEIAESVEEARNREDVLGRGKRWGIGGGLLGAGVGGLAGAGSGIVARKLGLPDPIRRFAPAVGAAALGTMGAGLGYRMAKRQGQEEALADRAVSLARAIKARQAGMAEGFDMASLGYPKEASKTKTAEPTWAELGRALLRDPRVIGTTLGGLLGAGTGIATSEKGTRLRNAAVGAGAGAGMGMLAGSFASYPSKVLVPEKVESMAREIFNKTTQVAMEAGEARGKRQMIPMAQSVAGQDVETLKDIMNALSEKEQNALGQLSTFSQNIDTIRDM